MNNTIQNERKQQLAEYVRIHRWYRLRSVNKCKLTNAYRGLHGQICEYLQRRTHDIYISRKGKSHNHTMNADIHYDNAPQKDGTNCFS